jgi:hypothetical protein
MGHAKLVAKASAAGNSTFNIISHRTRNYFKMDVGQCNSPTLAATNGLAALELRDPDLFTPQKPERSSSDLATPFSACATAQPRSAPVSRISRMDFMRPCGLESPKGSSLLSSDFLPEDCLLQILRSLAHNDLARLACVNREFDSVACQDALWEPLCNKEFNVTAENVSKCGKYTRLPLCIFVTLCAGIGQCTRCRGRSAIRS